MYGWGLSLMIVGGLSFILPIFGRQFVLVTALGLTGVGSFALGILLFFVGFVLFVSSQGKSNFLQAPHETIKSDEPQRQESQGTAQAINVGGDLFSRAHSGDMGAQLLIGTAYLAGSNGLPRDPAIGVKYLKMVAEQGVPETAMFVSAIHVDKSFGVIDLDEASLWAEKAEKLGADTSLLRGKIETLRIELAQTDQHKALINLLVTRKGFTPEQAGFAINKKIWSLKNELQEKGLSEEDAFKRARSLVYKISGE